MADSGSISLYQSGQAVPVNGTYEAVGVDQRSADYKPEKAVMVLNKGDLLPNYEGRAIQWRRVEQTTNIPPSTTTKSQ